MGRFDRDLFIRFMIENRVIGFFEKPVLLKSGRQSNWYVNWRAVSGDAFLLGRLADFLIAFAADRKIACESFYGVPEGATKLGVIASFKLASSQPGFGPGSHVIPMGRGRPKEHGAPQDRFFLTAPRGRIAVVEDVTTTGGSLLDTLDRLSESGAVVVAAIGLTNRMERGEDGRGVKEAVEGRGVPYFELSRATDFLPAAYREYGPGEAIGKAIEGEFARYGIEPLKLT
jgi:orotate phosphoribosyltransferase